MGAPLTAALLGGLECDGDRLGDGDGLGDGEGLGEGDVLGDGEGEGDVLDEGDGDLVDRPGDGVPAAVAGRWDRAGLAAAPVLPRTAMRIPAATAPPPASARAPARAPAGTRPR